MGKRLTRIKTWWVTMTPTEKLHAVLHTIAVGGFIYYVVERQNKLYAQTENDEMCEKVADIIKKDIEEMPKKETSSTPYDDASALLHILWRHDDILFQEDYMQAWGQAEFLKGNMRHPALEIMDILNRADEDGILEQEDLFEAQGAVEDLTRYLAIKEDREEAFKKEFPWLNKVEEKKEEE